MSSFSQRWRALRVQRSVPNLLIALLVTGIVAFALADAVKKHYLSQNTVVWVVCFVPAVMIHEVSHGVVALWCGDDTAKQAKRLTLNPLRHIDPIGSIVVPLIFLLTAGFAWGWAKPVPVSVNRLRHPRNDAVLVGLAGPGVNILMATIAGVVMHLLWVHNELATPSGSFTLGGQFAFTFGVVNIVLAAFNLLPIPPLDGSALLERLIPQQYIGQYYQIRFFMIFILMGIVLTQRGSLNNLLVHVENWYLNLWL